MRYNLLFLFVILFIVIFLIIENVNKVDSFIDKKYANLSSENLQKFSKYNLYLKQSLLDFDVNSYGKKKVKIPLNVFHTYETQLQYKMKENYEKLKSQNPQFRFYFYDDNMRREFISKHFNKDVLEAYDTLLPGAYKADLWRYCILYKMGGIYMDIKYTLSNNTQYKLINLTDKEYYVRDSFVFDEGRKLTKYDGEYVAQGFLVVKKNNKIMLKCIEKIVSNCKNKDTSDGLLGVTGPALIAKVIHDNIELCKYADIKSLKNIRSGINYKNEPFLDVDVKVYKSYKGKNKKDYAVMWPNIYSY